MHRHQAGFSLIELAMAAAVFSVALVATTGLVSSSTDSLGTGITAGRLEAKAGALLDRIERELIQAGAETLSPAVPAGESAVSYRQAFDYQNEQVSWGGPLRIEFRADEAEDGVDNDSDGLVDEGCVVFIRNPGLPSQQETLLARGIRSRLQGEFPNGADDNGNGLVDERGLCFAVEGEALVIRLSLEGRDTKGRIITRTATTAVRLRN
jgi:prepilin-type N-terminal cleavage/methylation domain-containing protein